MIFTKFKLARKANPKRFDDSLLTEIYWYNPCDWHCQESFIAWQDQKSLDILSRLKEIYRYMYIYGYLYNA